MSEISERTVGGITILNNNVKKTTKEHMSLHLLQATKTKRLFKSSIT